MTDTPVSQLTGDQYHWEECAEACIASLCIDNGRPTTVREVAAHAEQSGQFSPTYGTSLQAVTNIARHFGLDASDPQSISLHDGLRQGQVIALIWSDSMGNPGTLHTGHYVRGVQDRGGSYLVMNPLGSPTPGQNHDYPSGLLEPNYRGQLVVVRLKVGAPTSLAGTGNDLIDFCNKEGLNVGATADAIAAVIGQNELGRNISQDELNLRSSQVQQNGGRWTQLQLQNSAEGAATRAARSKATGKEY